MLQCVAFFPAPESSGGGVLTLVPVFCLISTMSFKLHGILDLVENDRAFWCSDVQRNRVEILGSNAMTSSKCRNCRVRLVNSSLLRSVLQHVAACCRV